MKFQFQINLIIFLAAASALLGVSSYSRAGDDISNEIVSQNKHIEKLREIALFTNSQLEFLNNCKVSKELEIEEARKVSLPMKATEFVKAYGFPNTVSEVQNIQVSDPVEIIWMYGEFYVFVTITEKNQLEIVRIGLVKNDVIRNVK